MAEMARQILEEAATGTGSQTADLSESCMPPSPYGRLGRTMAGLFGVALSVLASCEKSSPAPAHDNKPNEPPPPTKTFEIKNPNTLKDDVVVPSAELQESGAWKAYAKRYGEKSAAENMEVDYNHGMETPLTLPSDWLAVKILNPEGWDPFSIALLNSQIHLISNILAPNDPRISELLNTSYWAMSPSEPEYFFGYAAYRPATEEQPEHVKVRIDALHSYIYNTISLIHEGFHLAHHKPNPAKPQPVSERDKRAWEVDAHHQEVQDCDAFIKFLRESPLVSDEWKKVNLDTVMEQITAWKNIAQDKAHIYDIGAMLIDLGAEQGNLHSYCTKNGLTEVVEQLDQLRPTWRTAVESKLGAERFADARTILDELERIIESSSKLKMHKSYEPFTKKVVIWRAALKGAEDHHRFMQEHYSGTKE